MYDFFVTTFQVWKEFVDFQFVPVMETLADKARVVVSFDAIAFILGLGYVMGLRSSMILVRGRRAVELRARAADLDDRAAHAPTCLSTRRPIPIAEMTATQIFRGYVRFIGVGAIATAGIFGIVKSLQIVVAARSAIALKAFRARRGRGQERTDRDMLDHDAF